MRKESEQCKESAKAVCAVLESQALDTDIDSRHRLVRKERKAGASPH